MPDYSLGKIYMITADNADEGDVYIGSTCQKYLCERLRSHKSRQSCTVKILIDKYGKDNIYIKLIKDYPTDKKQDLINEECKYIRNTKCLNKRVENSTIEERLESRKQYRQKTKEHRKQYLEKNKEKIRLQAHNAYIKRKLKVSLRKGI